VAAALTLLIVLRLVVLAKFLTGAERLIAL